MTLPSAQQAVGDWTAALAARAPTPGGGAAAALAAAIGAAAGAMAARYTTGKRWAAVADRAQQLAAGLDATRSGLLALADEDAAAFAELQASWKRDDLPATQRERIEARARAVPVAILDHCATQAAALVAFLPDCNPTIVSDAKVGIHLLAGAGRAAWQTLLVNRPDAATRGHAQARLAELARCETACD